MKKAVFCGAAMLVLLMLLPASGFAEEKAHASIPVDSEVEGLWAEVPGFPNGDASFDGFQLGSSGTVSYSRSLDEDALRLTVERFPAPKEAEGEITAEKAMSFMTSLTGFKGTGGNAAPTLKKFSKVYPYPCMMAVYRTEENGTATRNSDVLIFTGKWIFRLHTSTTVLDDETYDKRTMDWIASVKLVDRPVSSGR